MRMLEFRHRFDADYDGNINLDASLKERFTRIKALADAIHAMTLTESNKDHINEIAWMIQLEIKDCEVLQAEKNRTSGIDNVE